MTFTPPTSRKSADALPSQQGPSLQGTSGIFWSALHSDHSGRESIAGLKFDHAQGLSAKGEELIGFEIAGTDGRFYRAQTKIDGSTVLVFSPDLPTPEFVRYGWANSPECNLYNSDGLPASPFRSAQ